MGRANGFKDDFKESPPGVPKLEHAQPEEQKEDEEEAVSLQLHPFAPLLAVVTNRGTLQLFGLSCPHLY